MVRVWPVRSSECLPQASDQPQLPVPCLRLPRRRDIRRLEERLSLSSQTRVWQVRSRLTTRAELHLPARALRRVCPRPQRFRLPRVRPPAVGLARHLQADNTARRLPQANTELRRLRLMALRLPQQANTVRLRADSSAPLQRVDSSAVRLRADSLAGHLKVLKAGSLAHLPQANTVLRKVARWCRKAANTAWPRWVVPWEVP